MKQPRSNPMPIDPETELTDAERGSLVAILDSPGWQVFRKVMEIQIARFDLDVKNASKAEDVIFKHSISKAASQFYVQIIDRLNIERELLFSAITPDQILPSVTDALIED